MMAKPMSKDELEKWERERIGGKNRYVLRNAIAWSLAATSLTFIANFVYPIIFSRPYKSWFDIIGFSAFIFFMFFISCWIWLQIKRGRNEQNYLTALSLKNKSANE